MNEAEATLATRRGPEGPRMSQRRDVLGATTDLDKKVAAFLFVSFLILYGVTIKGGQNVGNGASRLALVQSIVEEGTLSIDHTSLTPDNDRAFVRGHYYSDKAPGMSLTAVPLYWGLRHLGISFERNTTLAANQLKAPFAALAALVPVLFFLASRYYARDLRSRLLVSVALGAGTGVFVYSGVFLSHSSAAALLLLSFYFSLRARDNGWWLWLSGAASGVAMVFEYAAVLPAIAIHLNYLAQWRRLDVSKALLAVAPFVAVILLYNLSITGNALDFPAYHVSDWPGSPWPPHTNQSELARVTVPRVAQMFFFNRQTLLFSSYRPGETYYQGLFLYSPFLLLGLLFCKRNQLMLLLGSAAVCFLYLTQLDIAGGCAYSNRFLVITVPFLALPTLEFAHRWPKTFSIAAGVSIIVNFIGAITDPLLCAQFPLVAATARLPTSFLRHPWTSTVALLLILLILSMIVGFNSRKGDALATRLMAP